jgi:hypothetical protein
MEIQYSSYTLRPKIRANRLSTLAPKSGVFLRTKQKDGYGHADYFPHAELGDSPIEKFLTEFKSQNNEYDRKLVEFIKKDFGYRSTLRRPFFNHQLWTGIETLKSPVIKYKMLKKDSELYLNLLNQGIRIRFDGNALFTRDELISFIQKIPKDKHHLIDYMEDPLLSLDWSNLPIPVAQDFIKGTPYDFCVHKPNSRFYPETQKPVIFSGYLGSDLGFWHAYCELMERGDLSLAHGLVVEDFFEDQKPLFKGEYDSLFVPDEEVVKEIYRNLESREWKILCSI